MAEFTIEIANHTARVLSLFDSTRDYCNRYLTEKPAQFHITVTPAELHAQQQLLLEEALQEGLRPRRFSDPFLERTVIQEKLADLLLERQILMIHGSTVSMDGLAYLFTAKCGTGKSTHTRLWRQAFPDRTQMINDDKPFLRLTPDGVFAHGAPWSGKHGLDTNLCAPLQGICLLERGSENRIRPMEAEEALPLLLHQTHGGPQILVEALCHRVSLWHMTCTKDLEAAHVAFQAMSPQGCTSAGGPA